MPCPYIAMGNGGCDGGIAFMLYDEGRGGGVWPPGDSEHSG